MSHIQHLASTSTKLEAKAKSYYAQYSFNEFVPREFPREKELKEQTQEPIVEIVSKIGKKIRS